MRSCLKGIWAIVVLGIIIPIVLAFLFSLFLRLFARIIVYSLSQLSTLEPTHE